MGERKKKKAKGPGNNPFPEHVGRDAHRADAARDSA